MFSFQLVLSDQHLETWWTKWKKKMRQIERQRTKWLKRFEWNRKVYLFFATCVCFLNTFFHLERFCPWMKSNIAVLVQTKNTRTFSQIKTNSFTKLCNIRDTTLHHVMIYKLYRMHVSASIKNVHPSIIVRIRHIEGTDIFLPVQCKCKQTESVCWHLTNGLTWSLNDIFSSVLGSVCKLFPVQTAS